MGPMLVDPVWHMRLVLASVGHIVGNLIVLCSQEGIVAHVPVQHTIKVLVVKPFLLTRAMEIRLNQEVGAMQNLQTVVWEPTIKDPIV